MKNKGKKIISMLMASVITLTSLAPVKISLANAPVKTMNVNFAEVLDGTNRSRSVTIPNLQSIESVSVNTGNVSHTVSGDTINLNVSGGSYSRREWNETKFSRSASTSRTSGSNSFSNSISHTEGSYSGTLFRSGNSRVISGTPADSRHVTVKRGPQTSTSFTPSFTHTEGAYSGTLTRSGSHFRDGSTSNSRVETTTRTSSNNSFSNSISYNSGGYSGTLFRSGNSWVSSGSYSEKHVSDTRGGTHTSRERCDRNLHKEAGASLPTFGGSRWAVYQGRVPLLSTGDRTWALIEALKWNNSKIIPTWTASTRFSNNGASWTWSSSNQLAVRKALPDYFWTQTSVSGGGPYWNGIWYSKDGYSGQLSFDEAILTSTNMTSQGCAQWQNGNYRNVRREYTTYASGTVSTADTRVWSQRYSGTVTGSVPTYSQNYSGTIFRPDTRTWRQDYSGTIYQGGWDNYYSYTVTIRYIDNQAPILNMTETTPNNKWYARSEDFRIRGNFNDPDLGDTVNVRYRIVNRNTGNNIAGHSNRVISDTISGGTTGNFSHTINMSDSNLPSGNYRIEVWAVDNHGTRSTIHTRNFNVDKTNPVMSHSLSPSSWTNGNVNIRLNTSDNFSGIKEVTLPNGSKTSNANPTFTATDNGTYTFSVVDNVGNTSNRTVTVSNIDRTAPTLSLTPSTTNWINQDVIVTAVGSDSGDFVSGVRRIQTPDGTWHNRSSLNHAIDRNGTYTFRVEDNAGNVTTESITINNIDKTLPTINVTQDITQWTNTDVNLNVTTNDNASGVKRIQTPDGTWHNRSSLTYRVEVNGTYTFRVEDVAGNVRTHNHTVSNIDKVKPDLTYTLTPNRYTNTDVDIRVSATDADSGVRRIKNPDEVWANSSSITYRVAENGTYSFSAQDIAGNIRDMDVFVGIIDKIDPNKPTINLTEDERTWVNRDVIATIIHNGNDGVSDSWVEYKLEGDTTKGWTKYDGPITIKNDGKTTVVSRAVDSAGNKSEEVRKTVYVDQTAPVLQSFVINDGDEFTGSSNLNLKNSAYDSLSGLKNIQISTDGGNTWLTRDYSNNFNHQIPAGDGNRTVHARVEDVAGNISNIRLDSIILDETKPEATLLINGGDAFTATRDVELTVSFSDATSGVKSAKIVEGNNVHEFSKPFPTGEVTLPWTLEFGIVKTVTLIVEDYVGNVRTVEASIIVDRLKMEDFSITDVVNPTIYHSNNPFTPKSWEFNPKKMLAGGNISFASEIKEAVEPDFVSDRVDYLVRIVNRDENYEEVIEGSMPSNGNIYEQTVTIPKDAPVGSEVYVRLRAERTLSVSPYDTQVLYFPNEYDSSEEALIGIVEDEIRNVINFREIN